MKKLMFFTVFLLLSLFPQTGHGETNDVTPPVFKSLTLDKNVVLQGEEPPVATLIAEDESPIKRVELHYLDGNKRIIKNVLERSSDTVFEGRLNLEVPGRYQIQQIVLEDEHHNMVQVWNSAAGYTGKVMANLESGNLHIKRNSASFYREKIKEISVTVEEESYGYVLSPKIVTEPFPGLENIQLTFTSVSTKEEYSAIYPYYHEEEGASTRFVLPALMDNGPWELTQITLNPGIHPIIYKDINFPDATFELGYTNEPAEIDYFHLEKNEILLNERLHLTLKAPSNRKQVDYQVNAIFETPKTKRLIAFPLRYFEFDQAYKFGNYLTGYEPGEYTFKYFELTDYNFSKKLEVSNPTRLSFTYYGDKYDRTELKLNYLYLKNNFSMESVNKRAFIEYVYYQPEMEERVIVEKSPTYYNSQFPLFSVVNPVLSQGKWYLEKIIIKEGAPTRHEIVIWNEDFAPNNQVKTMDLSSFDLLKEDYEVRVNDSKAPKPPTVKQITDLNNSVSGTAAIETTIRIKVGSKEYTVPVGTNGTFNKTIKGLEPGTKLLISAIDPAGNASKTVTIYMKDVTRPAPATMSVITNKSKSISGIAQPGADLTVKVSGKVIAKGVVPPTGKYSIKIPVQKEGSRVYVYVTDQSKLSSKTFLYVRDVIPPNRPKVNKVTVKSKYVTGKTEPYAWIEVKVKNKQIGVKRANKKGEFKVAIKPQKANTTLVVIARDQAGSASKSIKVSK